MIKEGRRLILAEELPSISEKTFDHLWDKVNEQWEWLKKLICFHVSYIRQSLNQLSENQPLDVNEHGEEVTRTINDLSEDFYQRQRYLFTNSYIQMKLKTYQVFLCHAGEQKKDYVSWLYKALIDKGVSVFFDELSLPKGEINYEHILYAATTCQIAIIVLSKEFLMKEWPMREFSIFAARMRRRDKLLRRARGSHIPDDQLLDLSFNILPDLYDKEERGGWIDTIHKLPNFLSNLPTGFRYEETLEILHAEAIVNRTIEILSNGNSLPMPRDEFSLYTEHYSLFREKRNYAFSLLNEKKKNEEIFAEWMLSYVLREYKEHHRTGSPLDLAFQSARVAGRSFLSYALDDSQFIRNNQSYFTDSGYCELNNAFLFTAPLDALNFLSMKSNLGIKDISTWAHVLVISDLSVDKVHLRFLEEYHRIQTIQRNSSTPNDPFDEENMAEVLSDIARYVPRSPESLKTCAKKILSYLK